MNNHGRILNFSFTAIVPVFAAIFLYLDCVPVWAQQAAEKKTSVEVTPESTVPEGSPEELFQFIETLEKPRTKILNSLELRTDLRRSHGLIVSAVDRILGQEVKDVALVRAVHRKFDSLGVLIRLGDEAARGEMFRFAQKYRNHPQEEIATEAGFHFLELQWQSLDPNQEEDVRKLVTETSDLLPKISHASRQRVLALQGPRILEQTGKYALAEESYKKYAESLSNNSPDEKARLWSKKLLGASRRLSLMGREIEFFGMRADNQPLLPEQWKNKVVLVSFGASWCGPYVTEIPRLKQLYQTYKDRGFEIVDVNLDVDSEKARIFLEQSEIPWIVLLGDDPQRTGWEHPMAVHYGILNVPQAVLLNREGKVVSLRAWGNDLEQFLEKMLGPARPPQEDSADAQKSEKKESPED